MAPAQPVQLGHAAALRLIHAVDALVAGRMIERPVRYTGAMDGETSLHCQECFRIGLQGKPVVHATNCAVGEALLALEVLRLSLHSVPTFCATEVEALRRSVAGPAELADPCDGDDFVAANPHLTKHVGILSAYVAAHAARPRGKSHIVGNFITGQPTRHIEYDQPAPEEVGIDTETQPGFYRCVPRAVAHEEAAREREQVFAGDRSGDGVAE